MSIKLMAALMTAGIFWATQVYADDTTDDVRCLVVSLEMASDQNATIKTSGTISAMYWFGRLDGRTPDLDLENRVLTEIAAMKPDDLKAEAVRCGAVLQARAKSMSEMGQDLQAKGRAQMQMENSR